MRFSLAFAVMAMAVPGLVTAPEPAFAQTRAEMNEKIESLEKQLRAIQRRVFDQDSPYFESTTVEARPASPPAGGAPASSTSAGSAGLLADLTVRAEELSSQLSALTGQVEELRHENRQLRERLSRFEQDVNARLSGLEDGGQGRAGSPGAGEAQPQGPGSESFSSVEDSVAGAGPAASRAGSGTGSAGSNAAPALPQGSPQEQYDHAYGLLRRGQMQAAEQSFRAFLDRHEEHDLAANAQYWLGETYYVRQQYPQAAQAFLGGYQDYAESGKAADSLLKLGMTLAAMGQTEDACAAFDELEARFPDLEDRIARRMTSERARLGCS